MEGELIWKDIPGYEGYYQVSNTGLVKRIKYTRGKAAGILSPGYKSSGYPYANLCVNGKMKNRLVHQIVMLAFEGKCPDGMEINHIDGNRKNCHVSNLEYVTHKQNMRHSATVLDSWAKHRTRKIRHSRILTHEIVNDIRQLAIAGEMTQRDIAKLYYIHYSTVNRIISGESWNEGEPKKPRLPKLFSRKLNPDIVREIRQAVASKEATQRELATRYNVCEQTISHIMNGKAWRNVK